MKERWLENLTWQETEMCIFGNCISDLTQEKQTHIRKDTTTLKYILHYYLQYKNYKFEWLPVGKQTNGTSHYS